MRALLLTLGVLAVTALVVVGLLQAGGSEGERATRPQPFDLGEARRQLAGAPAPLAALHAQAAEILPGGRSAFRDRLDELEGHPVVVNKWASWCPPCRAEFPAFQAQSTKRGREIAFLGINAGDKRPAAERFLASRPVPFPSYEDPREDIARTLRAGMSYPVTVFIDRRGRTAFIHQGGYASEADLAADIDRYLPG